MEGQDQGKDYQDLLPVMAEKLDANTFVSELCGGFQLLADENRGLITPESLRKMSGIIGMEGMTKEDLEAMVRQGDMDGDGFLNETEFCVLMVRLSPGMMDDAEMWLEKALEQEMDDTKRSLLLDHRHIQNCTLAVFTILLCILCCF